MRVGLKISVRSVKLSKAVCVMHSRIPLRRAVHMTTVRVRMVGAVRSKICENRPDDMRVNLSFWGRGTHHNLGHSCMIGKDKIGERTGSGFDLAGVCPFESAMNRWYTCRRGGGRDESRRRARWTLSALAR